VEGGGDVEIKARWQGNDFVVERKVSAERRRGASLLPSLA